MNDTESVQDAVKPQVKHISFQRVFCTGWTSGGATGVCVHKHGAVHVGAGGAVARLEGGSSQAERRLSRPPSLKAFQR